MALKRTGIKRGTTRMRRGRLKSVNKPRKAKALEKNFGPLAFFVRDMGCCICVADSGLTQACHVKTRGASNHAWLDSGDGNLIPMCAPHHRYQHDHGWNALVIVGGKGAKGEGQAMAAEHAKKLGDAFLAAGGERY